MSSKFRQAWRELGWRGRLGMLRSYSYITQHRLSNRVQDLRAVLAGACNASTWNESLGDYAGGYSHWRCGKKRGHLHLLTGMDQTHRFNNYIWRPGDKVEFSPIPVRGLDEHTGGVNQAIPFRVITGRRHGIDTMRRARIRRRRAEEAREARRREREAPR